MRPERIAAQRGCLRCHTVDGAPHIGPTWAGAFGTTETGLPSIGAIPKQQNCYAVLGFGGNGITYSRIAADILSAEFAGKPDPDADLYAF